MSPNVQVKVFTGKFEEEAVNIIASGTMQMGIEKEKGNVTSIVAYDGVLKDGIIKKANEEVKENRR